MSTISKAVSWAVDIAQNAAHGYDQIHRWGPDYDCSSFLITAWELAGVPVKSAGATYTGNMKNIFLANGFIDVTSLVNLSSGAGLKKGDIVLNIVNHTAMCISSENHQLVMASANEKGTVTGGQTGDQTGGEIKVRSYYNYPWDCVLRYSDSGSVRPGESQAPDSEGQVPGDGSLISAIDVDGSFGPATVRRTQQFLGVAADGIVSNQPLSNKKYLYSAYDGCWEFKSSGYSEGSDMARALQKLIGAGQDGWFGRESVMKFQAFLGVAQDGSMGPDTVRAWQQYLNTHE